MKSVPERDRRTVAIPTWLVEMLLEHQRRQDDEHAMSGVAGVGDDIVFCTPGGGWVALERSQMVLRLLLGPVATSQLRHRK